MKNQVLIFCLLLAFTGGCTGKKSLFLKNSPILEIHHNIETGLKADFLNIRNLNFSTIDEVDGDGTFWMLFTSDIYKGKGDLWIAFSEDGEIWKNFAFIGITTEIEKPGGYPFILVSEDSGGVTLCYKPLIYSSREWITSEDEIEVKITKENFSQFTKDSDKDGLVDLVERRFLSDPYNPDTDGDGILDGMDKNLLVAKKNKYSDKEAIKQLLVRALLEEKIILPDWNISLRKILVVQTDEKIEVPNPPGFVLCYNSLEIENFKQEIHRTYFRYILFGNIEIKKDFAQATILMKYGNISGGGETFELRKEKDQWEIVRSIESWVH